MMLSPFVQFPSLCLNKIHREVATNEAIARSIKFITNVDPKIIARLCFLTFGPRIGGATS